VSTDPTDRGSNFICDIIEADLAANTHGGRVVTRFPPEPNGYMHIGHAKAICIDFGMAAAYGGHCHLRFDDTNPVAEDAEYVNGIKEDIHWLGFDWGDRLFFASDFFGEMVELARGLIRDRKAYVCTLSESAFREIRGTVTTAGTESPGRQRSVEENLDLFARMAAGEFEDGHCVLRAVGDMSHANMKLRDPPLYRIRNVAHHRTGDAWCIYPMYDFAHPLEDALEDVTHSLCSLEFQDNRALYDWVIENTAVTTRPRQYEFARLNLTYTVTSKRKLRQLIEEGHVSGWDDPRMPTLRGLRRLGVPPEAIRNFVERIGVAKTNSIIDMSNFEWAVRDTLNTMAPRVMAVLDPLKVIVDNYPSDQVEWLDSPYWPHDIPKEGNRKVPFTRELFVERADFSEQPPKGWRRMSLGAETRLRYGYVVRCTGVDRDEGGRITALHVDYDKDTTGGNTPDGRKVKGTIHWVSASEGLRVPVHVYDRLFKVENPDGAPGGLLDHVNPDSLSVIEAVVEPSLADAVRGSHWQFERTGYFVVDTEDTVLRFNRTVGLKDSWATAKTKPTPKSAPETPPAPVTDSEDGRRKRKRKARTAVLAELFATDPELAQRFERYQDALGLSESDATTLAGDRALSDFFESAINSGPHIVGIANWTINAVQAFAKEYGFDTLQCTGPDLATLVERIADGSISSKGAKKLFAAMARDGGSPDVLIERLSLAQITDETIIQGFVDAVIADNSSNLDQYRGGNHKLFGFFVGAVLRASGGRAAPEIVNRLLKASLSD
jgi:glutaminyl-tRNA synthetase